MKKLFKSMYYKLSPNFRSILAIRRLAESYEEKNERIQNDLLDLKNEISKYEKYLNLLDEQCLKKEDISYNLFTGERFEDAIIQYIMEKGKDVYSSVQIKKVYNYLKTLETVEFLPFAYERIDVNIVEAQLKALSERVGEKFVILTDIEELKLPWPKITIDDLSGCYEKTVVLVYNRDWFARTALEVIFENKLKYLTVPHSVPMARYYHTDQMAWETLEEECKDNPIDHYFCPVDAENIFQAIDITKKLEGDYVEIGTYLGASARAALRYMKKSGIKRNSYFLDVYEGFTYDEAKDSQDSFWYGTHTDTSVQKVREYLKNYPEANIIKSNIITQKLPDIIKRICVCNIDVDMYEAVKVALYKVKDMIVKGGIIIAEDYGHTPLLIGAQKAIREFIQEYPDEFISLYFPSGQLFLIKK
jgi:hypothetical protein